MFAFGEDTRILSMINISIIVNADVACRIIEPLASWPALPNTTLSKSMSTSSCEVRCKLASMINTLRNFLLDTSHID